MGLSPFAAAILLGSTGGAPHASGIAIGVFVGFTLLLLATGVYAACKRSRLPFTVALVVLGVGLAQLMEHGPDMFGSLATFRLSPEIILFVFLPTLIFESAFDLDGRQLRENITPVLTLAVPGLILSTGIIGLIVVLLTDVPLAAALLLGAILSATDPVAVIALFKRLGAPRRLTVLVEGESLLNDATAIVVAGILLEVAVGGTGDAASTALSGVGRFLIVFLGGLAVGGVLAGLCGWVLSGVRGDESIEITLTTVLAYGSFVIAEHFLHVSGVMAVIAAALLMGGWGRTKISPSISGYLHHFWAFAAFVANAMIFLLVGLSVDLASLWASSGLLAVVIGAMLVSRAAAVFGLVPLVGRITHPISRAYQAVMYWGGLRGAIALALALHLPNDFAYRDTFVALTTGAVLFTLLVQGLTTETLVRRLGLDRLSSHERAMRLEALIAAKRHAAERVPDLESSGLFSPKVSESIARDCEQERERLVDELNTLRHEHLDMKHERSLLLLQCFALERKLYFGLFGRGNLSERAYRDLVFSIDLQADAVRHHGVAPKATLHTPRRTRLQRGLLRLLDRLPLMHRLSRRLGSDWAAREYERAWARRRGSVAAIAWLSELPESEHAPSAIVDELVDRYSRWRDDATARLDRIGEQFPEFVHAMQLRLGERLVNQAERETIEHEMHAGILPASLGHKLLEDLDRERPTKTVATEHLHIDVTELLRRVPFFKDTPPDEFERVVARLREKTAPSGEVIIAQGERDDTLYLIARGVVRVSKQRDGRRVDVATLVAGEFFGEGALLFARPRNADCRAVTPCALYTLRRADLDAVAQACPAITKALLETARQRGG